MISEKVASLRCISMEIMKSFLKMIKKDPEIICVKVTGNFKSKS